MTSRQSRLRERRKAEGGKRLDVTLGSEAWAALEKLLADFPDLTQSQVIEKSLILTSHR